MAEVDPRIMNLMRAQLHKDRGPELAAPKQASSAEDEPQPMTVEHAGGIKGLLSRLALKASGPELSGD